MNAIIFMNGVNYDCNLHIKKDQIWLQSSKICFREIRP